MSLCPSQFRLIRPAARCQPELAQGGRGGQSPGTGGGLEGRESLGALLSLYLKKVQSYSLLYNSSVASPWLWGCLQPQKRAGTGQGTAGVVTGHPET